MCCENGINIDHIFLTIMTGLAILILYIDLKVLEEMFKEFFLIKNYVDPETYSNCYQPQAELRICFQCGAIFCAGSCVLLTAVLALGLSDNMIEKIATKTINSICLVFGPIMLVCSIYGFVKFRAIASVCDVGNIEKGQINFPGIFLLLVFFSISAGITITLIYEQTMSIVQTSFGQENSILYRVMHWYAAFNHKLQQVNTRNRR